MAKLRQQTARRLGRRAVPAGRLSTLVPAVDAIVSHNGTGVEQANTNSTDRVLRACRGHRPRRRLPHRSGGRAPGRMLTLVPEQRA